MQFFQSGLDLESNNSIHCLLNEKWLDVKYSGFIHNCGNSGFRCDSFLIKTEFDSYLIESVDESILGEFGQLEIEIYKLIVRKVRAGQDLGKFQKLDYENKFDLQGINEIEKRCVHVIYELDREYWTGEEISLEVVVGLSFCGKTPLMFGSLTPGSMFVYFDMEDIRKIEEDAFRIDILGEV